MAKRQATPEQKAKAEEKRKAFQALVKKIADMPQAEREAMILSHGAVLTVEGRELSPTNTMLCMMQCAGVTMIGGFQQWLRAGRCVRKGEHGFGIWIPVSRAAKAEATETSNDDGGEAGSVGFIMATVFDVAQTEEIQAESEAA